MLCRHCKQLKPVHDCFTCIRGRFCFDERVLFIRDSTGSTSTTSYVIVCKSGICPFLGEKSLLNAKHEAVFLSRKHVPDSVASHIGFCYPPGHKGFRQLI